MNNKAEQEAVRNIIIAVVALLVLALILFFIFKAQILERIRDSPGYSYSDKDKLIDAKNIDNLKSSLSCNVQVGNIKSISPERNFIVDWVSYSAFRIDIGGESTELLVYNSGSIQLDEWINEEVGYVGENGVIEIYDKWINDDILRSYHETIPSVGKLRVINGAYLTKDNKLCRSSG